MGGGIMFKYISNNNETGQSEINVPIPSMTIAGDKDGLYRITRNALGYWHQVMNINPEQKGKYPLALLKGGAHASFMDQDMDIPSNVMKNDLRPEVS